MNIQFVWDEAKRLKNLKDHGLDFLDVHSVFEGRTATLEDDRFDYGERRLFTLGFLEAVPVSIVHTETDRQIRVISFRFATRVRKYFSMKSLKAEGKRVRRLKDSQIRITKEHPELDLRHIVRSIVREGLKPVAPKTSISLRIDVDVLEWFKSQGAGYQTKMNAVLKAFKEASG